MIYNADSLDKLKGENKMKVKGLTPEEVIEMIKDDIDHELTKTWQRCHRKGWIENEVATGLACALRLCNIRMARIKKKDKDNARQK